MSSFTPLIAASLHRAGGLANSQATAYAYDNADRVTTTTFPNGVTETRTYDNADRLATILTQKDATTIVSYTYTVDPVGNRSQVVDTHGTTTFGYDSLYRLNAVTYPNADAQSYTYDPMGNRFGGACCLASDFS